MAAFCSVRVGIVVNCISIEASSIYHIKRPPKLITFQNPKFSQFLRTTSTAAAIFCRKRMNQAKGSNSKDGFFNVVSLFFRSRLAFLGKILLLVRMVYFRLSSDVSLSIQFISLL